MQTEITLPGRPYTKKNHQQIIVNPRTKRPMVIPSPQYRQYEEECLWRLKTYRGPTFEKTWVTLEALYYMPNKASWPDLNGLLQATCDILEKAGIIDNDKWVHNFGDSHIVGVDKLNPRVEITISEVEQ